MNKNSDRKTLEAAARAISNILKSKFSQSKLRFFKKIEVFDDYLGGCGISISKPIDHIPEFQVYFGLLPGGQKREFWYGFNAPKLELIENIIKISNLKISRRKISDCDFDKSGKTWLLKKPLSKRDMSLPIQETYEVDGQDYFIGSYVSISNKTSELPLQDAIDFFCDVVLNDPDIIMTSNIKSELEGVRGVATKQVIQRATGIINLFLLQREGNLKCELCAFDPAKKIIGTSVKLRTLLDVHHKTPLSEGECYTRIEDLQLLCPTCHRFEHARLRAKAYQEIEQ